MKERLLDRDIRNVLIERIGRKLDGSVEALILEELGLNYNSAIIDVAVISDETHGFEIKGTEDTLSRLPAQSKVYGKNFLRLTAVVASKHLARVADVLPPWWGIIEALDRNGTVRLIRRRKDGINPDFIPKWVVNFLWRSELLTILQFQFQERGVTGKNRQWLSDRLQEKCSPEKLHWIVRACFLNREGWKPDKIAIGSKPGFNFEKELMTFLVLDRIRSSPDFRNLSSPPPDSTPPSPKLKTGKGRASV